MPPASRKREKLCLCKCKTCRVIDPSGKYVGEGQWTTRSTRDRHVCNDRVLQAAHRAKQKLAKLPLRPPKSTLFLSKLKIIRDEMNWLAETPVITALTLVFKNDPKQHGPYVWPTKQELFVANTGSFALDDGIASARQNHLFLWVEARYYMIYRTLERLGSGLDVQELVDMALDGLYQLSQIKRNQWTQQTCANGTLTQHGAVFFNTGRVGSLKNPSLPLLTKKQVHFLINQVPRMLWLGRPLLQCWSWRIFTSSHVVHSDRSYPAYETS